MSGLEIKMVSKLLIVFIWRYRVIMKDWIVY